MGIQYSAPIDIDHGHLIVSTTTKKLKLGSRNLIIKEAWRPISGQRIQSSKYQVVLQILA